MDYLTKEKANEIIKQYKDDLVIIGANGGLLASQECAAYIAISEEEAKRYFDSIYFKLPENNRNFSIIKIANIEDMYSLSGFLNRPGAKYLYLIGFGYVKKDDFIRKNPDAINFIYERLKGVKDNEFICSIYKNDGRAFSPTEKFKQLFFSNVDDVMKIIEKYNNSELQLFLKPFRISDIVMGGYISDLLSCSFDGYDCSGWDLIEGVIKVFDNNFVGKDFIKEKFENKNNGVLILKEDGKSVLRFYGNAIIFTSKDIADKYLKTYIKDGDNKFEYREVEDKTEYMKLVNNSRFIFIDEEVHCRVRDFFMGLGLTKEQREWKNIEEVKEKVNELWNKDKLYIILSLMPQNIKGNTSVPYVVDIEPKCLWIFENLEEAKAFIDMADKGKINGKYPIGIIDNSKVLFSLNTTLALANVLGVKDIEFNPEFYECLHISIEEFYAFNNRNLETSFSTLQTDEEYKNNPVTGFYFNPFNLEIE